MPHAILERLVHERDQINTTINDILDQAEAGERDPSESERELITRHRARLDQLEPQIREMVDMEERRAASVDATALLNRGRAPDGGQGDGGQGDGGGTRRTSTGPQPFMYRSYAQWARDELILRFPAIAVRAGDNAEASARERMNRAVLNPLPADDVNLLTGDMRNRQAPPGSTLTADLPGLLPPQHLAQIMDVISRARPLVQAARESGLNAGKLTYPKITQRPQVIKQTGEKEIGGLRKMIVSMEELKAEVFSGSGDLSWQDIQWTSPNALALWFDLAAEAYAIETEGEAAAAFAAVTQNVAVAGDDLQGWIDAITTAAGLVHRSARRAPNTLVADITTGYHILGLVSHQAPVFFGAGSANLATGTGNIAGLQLVISYAWPTATPRVYVGDIQQLLRGETPGAPVQLRAVEPSIGGMEVGVIGAFAAKIIDLAAFVRLTPPAGAARVSVTATPGASEDADAEPEAQAEPEQAVAETTAAENHTSTRGRTAK